VGEFHYLHNAPDGSPYDDRAELARRVIAAAQDVGIRICVLNVCYATGGIDEPLRPQQRRFDTADVDTYLATTEQLATDVIGLARVSVGVAPHSIRAVPRDWITVLHAWASTRDLPFHMHVSEQPAEVEACEAAFGMRPVELLDKCGVLDDRFTGVHATHISDREVVMLAIGGGTVCACPSTERDLGDGFLRGGDLLRAGAQIALGTDSQTMLDMFEEARLVEYNERLRRLERVLLTRGADDVLEVAPVLLRMATVAGARSLRVPAGTLEKGALADFIAIDLDHIALAGWTRATLPAMLAFSAPPDAVSDVWVGGRNVVSSRVHAEQDVAQREFAAVARRLS
jgi:formimidoylglutamate deiminase